MKLLKKKYEKAEISPHGKYSYEEDIIPNLSLTKVSPKQKNQPKDQLRFKRSFDYSAISKRNLLSGPKV
jgi:hypothetical protein